MNRKSDTKVIAHARRELELAKAFDKNEEYDGSIGRAVLGLVKLFDQWAHGDMVKAESIVLGFNQLVNGELLSPPTTDPEEWEVVPGADTGTVRNKRSPFYVSTDNGKTWMHLQNKQRGNSRNHITGKDVEDETIPKTDEGGTEGDKRSSEGMAEQNGSGLDAGVEGKGEENKSKPKAKAPKPKAGKEK